MKMIIFNEFKSINQINMNNLYRIHLLLVYLYYVLNECRDDFMKNKEFVIYKW